MLERGAGEAEKVGEGAVEGENAAGEDFSGGGAAVGDGDGEAAEAVVAVGHACGAHGVGDKDGAVGALGARPDTDDFGGGVDAVADELGIERIFGEGDAEDAGLALIQRAHGVEGVGCADGSGGDDRASFGGGGVGVADRDADAAAGGVGGESGRAGQLGGEGHEADVAFGCVIEAVEESNVGGLEMLGRMDAALEVGEKWALEVNADGTGDRGGAGGVIEEAGEARERAERVVDGGGDGGGEVSAGAARGEEAADGIERGGCGLHDVVVERAMDVDVEKGGGEGCGGEIEGVGDGRGFGGCARGEGEDAAVFDYEDGVVEEVGAVPELRGGEDRGHVWIIAGARQRVSKSARQQFSETAVQRVAALSGCGWIVRRKD